MANQNDGSDNKNNKNNKPEAKPGAANVDPKKPTPIIDLKKSEFKVTTDSDDGKSGSGATKPNTKPDTKPVREATSSGSGSAGGSDVKADPTNPPSATKTATTTASATGSRPDDKSKAAASASAASRTTASQKPGPTEPDRAKRATPSAGHGSEDSDKKSAQQPPSPPPARSGRGMFGFLTHVAAGIAGGALVLFGAQPIEKQLGAEFLPRAKLPAEFGTRLAALEQRPTPSSEDAIGELTSDLARLRTKIAGLDSLRTEVAQLSRAAASSPTTDGGGQSATGPAVAAATEQLAGRVAKLEQTLETLSSATSGNGDPTDGARLAAVSGKISDIELTLNNQITALRESVTKELETRVTQTAQASAAAAAGTKRIDRDLALVKTDTVRLEQRAETLQAAQDKLSQAVRVAREEAAKLRADLDGLKGDVSQQFKSVAKPSDVATAVAPIAEKLAGIEQQMTGIVESETARKTNAQRIVLALELSNLKRVLNRGGAYAAELGEVRRMTGGAVDLSVLEKFQSQGVPTGSELEQQFSRLAYKIIAAADQPKGDSIMEQLLGGAKSLVRVRRADLPTDDKSVEAVVARIEQRLKAGNLTAVVDEAKGLPQASVKPAAGWLERVAARAEVDRAIADIENQLKSSIGSVAGTKG